ncbi:FISUMP domain-containing protein [Agriterribacter sp.]|uniref:FISUMP domain-containing protein n=1 Tax=Agriterribacter sp. TaxID=2821509 RepID=UPI002C521586|nr:FISUMP domain-containing protein [Agriterribacter sp.]HRP56695.1 FISUMP domain-containing protein [Agriterribacter sp.]
MLQKLPAIMLTAFTLVFLSCNKDNTPGDQDDDPGETGTVTDVDGNVYKTVKTGNQVWMAENLNVTHYNDGGEIYNATASAANPDSWIQRPGGLRCYYDNDENNGKIYGQLYNWAAVNSGKLAPQGWHIPTKEEWETLTAFLGGEITAGVKLKATTSWDNGSTHPGDNSSGFTGLAAGGRGNNLGIFGGKGTTAAFWSSTKAGTFLYSYILSLNSAMVSSLNTTSEKEGLSVRCVKN